MNRNAAQKNIESLTFVAYRLEELCNDMIFIGGCVTGLLITDIASPDVRFTVDVDCIVNVVTKSGYYILSEKLRRKGFKELMIGNHPLCRWDCDGILLDVVPIDKNVLGFSNRWYKDAILDPMHTKLNNELSLKIISAPYFLATKLEAFKDRGKQDFLLSHDLEDIIAILDGRPEIIDDISNVPDNLKQYLSSEFVFLMSNDQFMHALPGHLNYSSELERRKTIVQNRMKEIIELGE